MSESTRTFADHPKSLAEHRANRDGHAAAWTPRDVLIDILRSIDSGEITPTALVVAYATVEGDLDGACISVAAPNLLIAVGLLTASINVILSTD